MSLLRTVVGGVEDLVYGAIARVSAPGEQDPPVEDDLVEDEFQPTFPVREPASASPEGRHRRGPPMRTGPPRQEDHVVDDQVLDEDGS